MSDIADIRREMYKLESEFREKMRDFTTRHKVVLELNVSVLRYGLLIRENNVDYEVKLAATID
jgi:hypothetical protein